ncbi:MAG: SRPBCC domain-containing protein, partial [Phenylobacterium sp.]
CLKGIVMKSAWIAVAAALVAAGAARAEVTDKSQAGFEITQQATIAAPPAKVYAAILTPGAWWDSQHSWSGDAKNLSIDLGAGCFCEKLPAGYVRHMTVVFADGAKTLRLFGGLGPMQFTGAAGHMSFTLKPAAGGTGLTLTYDVGGYAKGGLAETWAAPVDGVLGEAVGRLKRYVETGKPD